MSSLQTGFSRYQSPEMVPNPQLELFRKDSEEQKGVLAVHFSKLQENILARSSRQLSLRQAAEVANSTRALVQHAPVVIDYSWRWPSYAALGGSEHAMREISNGSFSTLRDFSDQIGHDIASALSQPCVVLSAGHSIRVEFLGCVAWVMSFEQQAVFLEVFDAAGEWSMSRIRFNMADPFNDTLWLDQVLLPWIPMIEQAFGVRAVEAHWQLRQELECRYHRPEFINATSRQIRQHLNSVPVLDRVCKHIRKWEPEFQLDNEIFSNFWAEGPAWTNLTDFYPHLSYLYYAARKEGLIKAGSGLGGFRAMCRQLGISRAGWRFLSHLGPMAYEDLAFCISDHNLSTARLLAYIDWQARAGLKTLFPQVLGEGVMSVECNFPDNDNDLSVKVDPRLASVSNAYLGQLADKDAREWFFHQEWFDILMWVFQERPTFDRNQWRAGWQAIRNSYLKYLKQNPESLSWSPVLEPFVFEKWHIEPLTSSSDLAAEGMRMHHCVGTYDQACFEDASRVFSVEYAATREPVVTVSLKKTNDIWVLDQVKGRCNHDPDPQALIVAEFILEKFKAELGIKGGIHAGY